MGAFKLETFEVASSGASGLEAMHSATIERERNEAYAQGFKDGVDITKNAIDVERNQLLGVIEARLSAMNLTHEGAASEIQRSLAPLISAFFEALAPKLLDESFVERVCDQIAHAFETTQRSALRVVASPPFADQISSELKERGIEAEMVEGTSAAGNDVEIRWAGGVDTLSMAATLEDIRAQAHAYFSQFDTSEVQ